MVETDQSDGEEALSCQIRGLVLRFILPALVSDSFVFLSQAGEALRVTGT